MTCARRAPIIVAAGVGKSFSRGSQLAFTNINLEIRTGEFLCPVGPSGCGKSTFLFMVAGLVPLSVGKLEIDGVIINGPSRDRGLVFQESALFPWLSVRDNIAFSSICTVGRAALANCRRAACAAGTFDWIRKN